MKLTVKQATELVPFAPSTIAKAVKRGDIPAEKVGNTWQFEETDLLRWANDPEMHRQGKRATGEITQREAGLMLGITPAGVSWLIREGKLPRMLTSESVIEFELGRNRQWMYEAEHWLYGVSLNSAGLLLGHVGYGPDDELSFIEYVSFDTLFAAMKQIAPLTEWRVVKE